MLMMLRDGALGVGKDRSEARAERKQVTVGVRVMDMRNPHTIALNQRKNPIS